MTLCSQCGEDNPERAKFCLACAAPLERSAVSVERKTVTIVFSDLIGSTALSERLDPESITRVMSRYYTAMSAALERHGGMVAKFIGDAVMAVFGVPVLHEDDAVRAARAAIDMRRELEDLNAELDERWGVRLQTRIGINTGEVVAGDASLGESLVVGDPVNVAARLEQSAAPGTILIGEATYSLVRDVVSAEPVPALELKGKADRVAAFRLLDVVEAAPGKARRHDSPIVGREEELAHLSEAFERVARRSACELLTVIGPAGVGKSRLIDEVLALVENRALVVQGRCLPYGDGITFWPLAEALKTAAQIGDDDSAAGARQKMEGLLANERDRTGVAERVAGALGLCELSFPPEETFWAIRKLLEVLGSRRPLVIVFDDIHWAEPTFLDLLEYIATFSRGTPMLMICVARPELLEMRAAWGAGAAAATSLTVDPLGDTESRMLIENLLGQPALEKGVLDAVTQAADGNPLFLEELLRMLVDDGVLEQANGAWRAVRQLSAISVPPTIQALLAARLDRLEPPERSVLERAAVVGQVFWRGAVSELSPEPIKPKIWSYLQGLIRKELVRPDESVLVGEDAFRFGHILIRDAAYEGSLKEARAELHERFAVWLERKVGDRVAEYAEVIGHHLEQAYRYRLQLGPMGDNSDLAARGGRLLASAGSRAFARGDMPAALKLLERAGGLLSHDDSASGETNLLIGLAALQVGDLPRALLVLEETTRAARASGDRRLELHARVELANLQMLASPKGGLGQLRKVAEEAIPYFEQIEDEFLLARAWRHLADVPHMAGRMEEAIDALQRALEHARRAGNRREEGEVLTFLAGALYMTVFYGPMTVEEGVRRCNQIMASLPDAEDEELEGSFGARAIVAAPVSSIEAMLGRFAEARRVCARAEETLEELGQEFTLALGRQIFAWVEILADDFVAADRELRLSLGTLERMGEKSVFSTVAAMLALTSFKQARYDEADLFTRMSEEAAGKADVASRVLWRSVRASLFTNRGDIQAGEGLAREAVEIAEESEALNIQGDALLSLAQVLSSARSQEACAVASEALKRYQRKGNLVSAAKAEAFLVEHAAPSADRL
jgi:class 3 adenylate cyclase/tetratricopeptide (TPR) repeat protein